MPGSQQILEKYLLIMCIQSCSPKWDTAVGPDRVTKVQPAECGRKAEVFLARSFSTFIIPCLETGIFSESA